MYADRYARRNGLKPGSMVLALGMTALPIAGLVLSAEVRRIIKEDSPFTMQPIDAPKPPPPPKIEPKPQPDAKLPPVEKVVVPPLKLDVLPPLHPIDTSIDIRPTPQPTTIPGTGEIGTIPQTPKPVPVLTDAGIDSRYANAFQPPYPAEEVRAGREGRVVVRVLIGTDGRVKQVEKVSATTDAFFTAAERQALTKWRFKPATRDGVAIEQWKQMSLRFELNGNE